MPPVHGARVQAARRHSLDVVDEVTAKKTETSTIVKIVVGPVILFAVAWGTTTARLANVEKVQDSRGDDHSQIPVFREKFDNIEKKQDAQTRWLIKHGEKLDKVLEKVSER